MQDSELLESYSRTRSNEAFRTLVDRYLNLVYSACRRQLGEEHLAEDATQAVFLLLSQRAHRLPYDRIAGWLLTVSRYTCANIRKTERRRTHREQVVAMLKDSSSQVDEELIRILDDALAHLGAADREALALRYLQNTPLREVGLSLGISEEAARKRIDRAVDRLRSFFTRHRLASTSATLTALLAKAGQASILPPARQQMLTDMVLNTCIHGAAGAAPIYQIMKGTKLMMLTHSLKTIGAAACVASIAAIIGISAYAALPEATLARPAAATAPIFVADLSTPEKTLESYCRALKSGDRAAVYACCTTVDPARSNPSGDAFLTLSLAQNHLIRSAAKAFNSTGQEARTFPTLDLILEQVLAFNRARNQTATINGDEATLALDLPDAAIAAFPDDVQQQIRAFANHPLIFTKQVGGVGGGWKLGPTMIQVVINMQDNNQQPVKDEKLQLSIIEEYAAMYENIANAVQADKYPNWDAAGNALKSDNEQLHRKYNLSDINIRLTPATAPATNLETRAK